jgi:hypothetical protein
MLGHARFDELSVLSIMLNVTIVNEPCSCRLMCLYLSPNTIIVGIVPVRHGYCHAVLYPCYVKMVVAHVRPCTPIHLFTYAKKKYFVYAF